MDKLRICPECGREYNTFPAVSRRDDVTEICPECGREYNKDKYKRAKEFIRDVNES